MPYISYFFGIIIRMFFGEHNPQHFHAEYQGMRAVFDFDGNVISGNIKSKTALRLIKKWTEEHKKELVDNWKRGKKEKSLFE